MTGALFLLIHAFSTVNRNLLYAIAGLSLVAFHYVHSQRFDLKLKPVDMSFTATDGTQVDLSQMRGKVVLIDFWATWCPGCMQEAPHVVEAYNALHDKGLEVVGVSLDMDKSQMEAVTRQRGMVWPEYFDGKGWGNAAAVHFGVHSIPALWLLDKNGKLVDMDGREELQGKVEKLLAE
jgi:thiol-disulfide isomerase/thioredoxin